MQIEYRSDGSVAVRGYVNAVERDSKVLPPEMAPGAKGRFVERVSAGTFNRALERGRPVGLWFNHARPIGGTAEGTLTLREDAIGLYAEAAFTDAEVTREARAGHLTGWSFGFHTVEDAWEDAGDGLQRRTLRDIELDEVSILTEEPAYVGTSIEMRGEDVAVRETRGTEDIPETAPEAPDYAALRAEIEILRIAKKEKKE